LLFFLTFSISCLVFLSDFSWHNKNYWWLQITTFNISSVVHGTVAENDDFQKVNRSGIARSLLALSKHIHLLIMMFLTSQEQDNPYAVPIGMGIFKVLDSPLDITTTTIIRRIVSNHEAYQVHLNPLPYYFMLTNCRWVFCIGRHAHKTLVDHFGAIGIRYLFSAHFFFQFKLTEVHLLYAET
jgi:hypothetical protein